MELVVMTGLSPVVHCGRVGSTPTFPTNNEAVLSVTSVVNN